MARIYRGIDAEQAAEIVADALTAAGHTARAGNGAPVVFVGSKSDWTKRHGADRFTFREVYEDVTEDGRTMSELAGVEIAEVPQRQRSTLVPLAEAALAEAAR